MSRTERNAANTTDFSAFIIPLTTAVADFFDKHTAESQLTPRPPLPHPGQHRLAFSKNASYWSITAAAAGRDVFTRAVGRSGAAIGEPGGDGGVLSIRDNVQLGC